MRPDGDNVHDLFDLDQVDSRWPGRAHASYDEHLYGVRPEPRLRHVILVDGRLVDTWAEPIEGTEWEQVARRYDAQRACRHVVPTPTRHPYEEVLDWLDGLVGGRRALEELDLGELGAPARPTCWEPEEAEAFGAVEALLERLAARFRDREVHAALLQALDRLWDRDCAAITRGKSAAHVAGGLCWIVGRANGLFTPDGVSQKDVQRDLRLTSPLSSVGGRLQRSIRGLEPHPAGRPSRCPDLVAVGDPDLLASATRRVIASWRDRARAARDAHLADRAAAGHAAEEEPARDRRGDAGQAPPVLTPGDCLGDDLA